MPLSNTFAAAAARGFGFGTEDMFGEQTFTGPGTTNTFIVPSGVYSLSMVAVGAGGSIPRVGTYPGGAVPPTLQNPPGNLSARYYAGGGGALAYKNAIAVTPGQVVTIYVGRSPSSGNGEDTYVTINGVTVVRAGGGRGDGTGTGGAVLVGDGGGAGGAGSEWLTDAANQAWVGAAGGGAGGYTGAGGAGAGYGQNGSSGSGGGGGGGGGGAIITRYVSSGNYITTVYAAGGGGGGVGLLGLGTSGAGGQVTGAFISNIQFVPATGGAGGSLGTAGSDASSASFSPSSGSGGGYGGGGGLGGTTFRQNDGTPNSNYGSGFSGTGGNGAVRVIWTTNPTITRAFPSTNVGRL